MGLKQSGLKLAPVLRGLVELVLVAEAVQEAVWVLVRLVGAWLVPGAG
jgi:hypothetical protein